MSGKKMHKITSLSSGRAQLQSTMKDTKALRKMPLINNRKLNKSKNDDKKHYYLHPSPIKDKRIQVDSDSDNLEINPASTVKQKLIKVYLDNWGGRHENGGTFEPRKICCVTNSKGSAYVEYGDTKVLAEVLGTKECGHDTINKFELNCNFSYAFSINDEPDINEKREATAATVIKSSILPIICRDKLTNLCIDLKVSVLDDNGCVISTAIIAAGLALINAGVPVFSIVTAATTCYINGKEIPNPTGEIEESLFALSNSDLNENDEYGIVITSLMLSEKHITNCYQKGYIRPALFEKMVKHNVSICDCLMDVIRLNLTNNLHNIKESDLMKTLCYHLDPVLPQLSHGAYVQRFLRHKKSLVPLSTLPKNSTSSTDIEGNDIDKEFDNISITSPVFPTSSPYPSSPISRVSSLSNTSLDNFD